MSDNQIIDFSSHAGAGTENVTNDDLQVPFLQLIQTNSAEVDKGHPDYAIKSIEGAESGDIINTVTRTIVAKHGTPLSVIPINYSKAYVEWRPRNQGGGIVKVHTDANILSDCTKSDNYKDVLPNGNEVVTTAYYIVMYNDNDDWSKAIVAMQATQLKKSRAWLSKITSIKLTKEDGTKFQAPIFSHQYSLTSVTESNSLGSWFGWKIELDKQVDDNNLVDQATSMMDAQPALQVSGEEPY